MASECPLYPESGYYRSGNKCPLCAKSGHSPCLSWLAKFLIPVIACYFESSGGLLNSSRQFSVSSIRRGLNMTALQGWIVIGLLVLIMLGIVGIGAELKALPYLWRAAAEAIQPP